MKTFKHGNRIFENVKSDEILKMYENGDDPIIFVIGSKINLKSFYSENELFHLQDIANLKEYIDAWNKYNNHFIGNIEFYVEQ